MDVKPEGMLLCYLRYRGQRKANQNLLKLVSLDEGAISDVKPSSAYIALDSKVKLARPRIISLDHLMFTCVYAF
jgi:hypothetical protein